MTRVLVAFDKFKGSLTAKEACEAAAAGIRAVRPDWEVETCPLTDGGDGFAKILTEAARGEWRRAAVSGPRGAPVVAGFGLVPPERIPIGARAHIGSETFGSLGVVDLASASGLQLLEEAQRDPWQTSTRGTGELIAAAIQAGAGEILLGIGGSATNDLGLGALAALGLRPLDEHGAAVDPPVPANWPRIARFDPFDRAQGGHAQGKSGLCPIWVACDVSNPLLGANGAAAVFGPQKGLAEKDVRKMGHESARIALMLCHHFRKSEELLDGPGTGAAGGLGFGFGVAGIGRLIPGSELVAAWLGLDRRMAEADLVLTGEGKFDASSLAGKAAGAVAKRAVTAGKRVLVFAGSVDGSQAAGVEIRSINPGGVPVEESMKRGPELLSAAVRNEIGCL